jgi:aspartyl/glutamyl-tRNA(Asn/Gln) amidotransferase C subunit
MNTDDVQKLATLARVDIGTLEAEELSQDMNKILGYIKAIEGAHVEMNTPKFIQTNVVRDDIVSSATDDTTALIKQNFPKEKNGFLEVNKIIQND